MMGRIIILIFTVFSFMQADNSKLYTTEEFKLSEYIHKDFFHKDYEAILRFKPIFFDSSSLKVKEKSRKYLKNEIIKMIKNYDQKNLKISVLGYTDRVPTKTERVSLSSWFSSLSNDLTKESSLDISNSFSKYVEDVLIDNNISKDIIIAQGKGGIDNLYLGTTQESRDLNYRAMVSVYVKKDIDADDDKDGVINQKDKCLNTPMGHPVNKYGCSEMLHLIVYYKVNSSKLETISHKKLLRLLDFIRVYTHYRVVLYGHTSSEGSEKRNQILSEKRALAIKNYLIENGIEASRMSAYGKASSEPLTSNETEEGRKLNRRVEIILR